uniref:DNA binding protein n=1 Tax=Rhizophora mucronata TaxID=61149 RepID=A0A2P2PDH6_RHIMU
MGATTCNNNIRRNSHDCNSQRSLCTSGCSTTRSPTSKHVFGTEAGYGTGSGSGTVKEVAVRRKGQP